MRRKLSLPSLPVRAAPQPAPTSQEQQQQQQLTIKQQQATPKKKVALAPTDLNRTPTTTTTTKSSSHSLPPPPPPLPHRVIFHPTSAGDSATDTTSSCTPTATSSSSPTNTTTTPTMTSSPSPSSTSCTHSSFTLAPGTVLTNAHHRHHDPTTSLHQQATKTPQPGARCDDDDDDDDENLDLVEFLLTPTPLKEQQRGVNEPVQTLQSDRQKLHHDAQPTPTAKRATTDVATSTREEDENVSEADNQQHGDRSFFEGVVRRLEQENARVATDASFLRDAASNMKARLVVGKTQLLLQLEHFAEVEMRRQIEEMQSDYWINLIEDRWAQTMALHRHHMDHSQHVAQLATANAVLAEEQAASVRALSASRDESKRLGMKLAQAEREGAASEAEGREATDELHACRASIKVMCKSWQSRFDDMKTKHGALQKKFDDAAEEVVRYRNAELQQLKLQRRKRCLVDAATSADPDVLFREATEQLSEWESHCRSEIASVCCPANDDGDDGLPSLVSRLLNSNAEALRKFREERDVSDARRMCGEKEVVKHKRRCEQVSAECERLVQSNGKLQKELLNLRKELYSV